MKKIFCCFVFLSFIFLNGMARAFPEQVESRGIPKRSDQFVIQERGWSRRSAPMPRPLSNDLRERIVLAVAGGMSRNATAKKYDVAISSVVKLMQRWQATRCWESKAMGGYRGHKLTPYQEDVLTILKEKTDITLKEFTARLKDRKIKISPSSLDLFFNYLGQGYKKNGSRQRARQARRKGGAGRMEEKSGNA